jgi:hypothetical protein
MSRFSRGVQYRGEDGADSLLERSQDSPNARRRAATCPPQGKPARDHRHFRPPATNTGDARGLVAACFGSRRRRATAPSANTWSGTPTRCSWDRFEGCPGSRVPQAVPDVVVTADSRYGQVIRCSSSRASLREGIREASSARVSFQRSTASWSSSRNRSGDSSALKLRFSCTS